MLTERMSSIYGFIKKSLLRILPEEYRRLVFSRASVDDIVLRMLFECCEYAFLTKADKGSLWSHMKRQDPSFDETDTGIALRMKLQRAAAYMNRLGEKLSEHVKQEFDMEIASVHFPKEDGHYSLSSYDFLTLGHVDDIQLVKVVLDRKFLSEKFYNDNFRACSNDYDNACSKLESTRKENDEMEVISSMCMFSLESQFYFDFLYEVTSCMEENHIRELPDIKDRFTAFCYEPTIRPYLSYHPAWRFLPRITVVSRAIHIRRLFVSDIVLKSGTDYEYSRSIFLELLYLIEYFRLALIYEDCRLNDWIDENTFEEDWASVFREYDVFRACVPNKYWSNKKIRYAKQIYKEMTFDYSEK